MEMISEHTEGEWQAVIDEVSGKTYYVNMSTQETRWDLPPSESKSDFTEDEGGDPEGDEGEQYCQKSVKLDRRGSAQVDFGEVTWGFIDDETSIASGPTGRLPKKKSGIEESNNVFFKDKRLSQENHGKEKNDSSLEEVKSLPKLQIPSKEMSSPFGSATGALSGARKFQAMLRSSSSFDSQSPAGRTEVHAFGERDISKSAYPQQPLRIPAPAASSIPIDALAQAGERSNKWLEYLKTQLLMTDHVKDAGIFDLRNCARWAATRDFLPRHYHIIDASSVHHGVNEAASTVFLMKSGTLPKHGLRWNGVLYEHESTETVGHASSGSLVRWAVSGIKKKATSCTDDDHWNWEGGIYLVRTSRAVVIATYSHGKGHRAEVCRAAVDGLAQFMTNYAC